MLACEVMKTDDAIRNLIREGKTPQIVNSIQTTGAVGNILMEKSLQNLYRAGTIDRETFERAGGRSENIGFGTAGSTGIPGSNGYGGGSGGYAGAGGGYGASAGFADRNRGRRL